jgi:hypothetical protein
MVYHMSKKTNNSIKELTDLPNIGKSIAEDLVILGIHKPKDLCDKDAFSLYEKLCNLKGKRQDPCVLDVFMAAISFVNGGPALPWWHFTDQRKEILRQIKK